jgi:hypothetical protein
MNENVDPLVVEVIGGLAECVPSSFPVPLGISPVKAEPLLGISTSLRSSRDETVLVGVVDPRVPKGKAPGMFGPAS